MIIKYKGVYHIERTAYNQDVESVERYNKKYGVENWIYSDSVCSGLCPSCGYGEPLNKSTCRFCDGKCVRSRKEF